MKPAAATSGRRPDDSWTTASWEAAPQRDPQAIVIVIVDYGAGPENSVDAKIALLRRQPLMAETIAVRENNIIALPYAALVESPRNPQAVVAVAEILRSKGYGVGPRCSGGGLGFRRSRVGPPLGADGRHLFALPRFRFSIR
ncbi:hypothetical protein [Nocardia sp. NPDC051750]|uniref:hypothetical protein n=1 Tax=Nocardia sp. NPDC051750 TaxID=3364325 RepID=UPI0037BCD5D8